MPKRRIYADVTIRIMSVTRRIFTFSILSVIIKPAQEQNKKGYGKMNGKKLFRTGVLLIDGFVLWTVLICTMDVQPIGVNGTSVGFAQLNGWFHQLTGVHMAVYHITDWLGLVPVCGCMIFAGIGLIQLVQRKNLLKVDYDILILGVYYVIVILGYLFFEMVPINYRPVLIEGRIEASYPSSTTLLVLSVMPTIAFQADRRIKKEHIRKCIRAIAAGFSLFMIIGRTISGVHWLTDIIGSVILSVGLYLIYQSSVALYDRKKN